MRIRNAQMKAFSDELSERFLDRLTRRATERFPEKCAGQTDAEVRSEVACVVEEARRFGLRSEADLTTFTDLSMERGPGFAERPEYAKVREVLTDKDLAPPERLRRVRELLSEPETPDPFGDDAEKDFAVPPAPRPWIEG